MKKFIMTSPFQPEGKLEKGIYNAADNPRLQYDEQTAFPIIPVINAYAEKGEKIEVVVIVSAYENAIHNFGLFSKELEALCAKLEVAYEIRKVETPYSSDLDTQLDLFGKLIECVADEDTLYACITYGFKPAPMILSMALNYGHRIRQNTSVGCIVYGAKDFNTGIMHIYDITSLLFMDEIVRIMADQKISDPTEKIKALLK
ncbi:MAG: TM1812 family CRISPR-associated protein [Oscillospiraceae bacterium]|nr:TM1812 family CRISPR-associated protein [Oscillospiraceae bacterium]